MAQWLTDDYKLTPSEIAQFIGVTAQYKVTEVADRNSGVALKIDKSHLQSLTKAKYISFFACHFAAFCLSFSAAFCLTHFAALFVCHFAAFCLHQLRSVKRRNLLLHTVPLHFRLSSARSGEICCCLCLLQQKQLAEFDTRPKESKLKTKFCRFGTAFKASSTVLGARTLLACRLSFLGAAPWHSRPCAASCRPNLTQVVFVAVAIEDHGPLFRGMRSHRIMSHYKPSCRTRPLQPNQVVRRNRDAMRCPAGNACEPFWKSERNSHFGHHARDLGCEATCVEASDPTARADAIREPRMEVSRVLFMTNLLLKASLHNCLHLIKQARPRQISDKN